MLPLLIAGPRHVFGVSVRMLQTRFSGRLMPFCEWNEPSSFPSRRNHVDHGLLRSVGPGIVQDLRLRRHQPKPWPGMGDVNETAEPYRVFPGLVVAETLG